MEESAEITEKPIACEVCGKRDETVRYVIFPFVFSIVVFTFQRTLGGRLCRRHRISKWAQASLITSLFGWLGIPFGFIFTPMRLFQLARGGIQNKDLNAELLSDLGDYNLQRGDYPTAIRCFESSLEFHDDPAIRERLKGLTFTSTSYDEMSSNNLLSGLAFIAAPILMAFFGLIIGLIDFGTGVLSGGLFGNSSLSIFIVIIFWVPLVALIFYSTTILHFLIRWILRTAQSSSTLVAVSLSLFSIFMLINWTFIGETFGELGVYLFSGYEYGQVSDLFGDILAILARGGFYFPLLAINSGEIWGIVMIVIMLGALLFASSVVLPAAIQVSKHQRILFTLRDERKNENQPSVMGMIGVFGLVLITIVSVLLTPQKSQIDLLEYYHRSDAGATNLDVGELELARNEFTRAISLKPNFLTAHYLMGITEYFSGRYSEAETELQQAIEIDPNFPFTYSYLGFIHLQEGKTELARQEFSTSLEIFPQNNLDARLGIAHINDLEAPERSISEYLAIVEEFPESDLGFLGLGNAYYAAHDFDNALEAFQAAIKLNRDLLEAHLGLGQIYMEQGEYEKSKTSFDKSIEIFPESYEAALGLCSLNFYQNEYDDAISCVDEVIANEPERPYAFRLKGIIFTVMGEHDAALDALDIATQYDDIESELYMAVVYYRMAMPEKADEILNATLPKIDLIDIPDDRIGAYLLVGGIYTYKNQLAIAERYYSKAQNEAFMGLDGNTLIDYANILAKDEKYSQAESVLRQVEGIGHSKLKYGFTKSSILFDQGKLNEALEQSRFLLKTNPESSDLHAFVSEIYFLQNEIDKAEKEVKLALRYDLYNSYAYRNLAFVFEAQDKINEAVDAANESIRLDSTSALAHYILAVCYVNQDMDTAAIAEFEEFLRLYHDNVIMRMYKERADEYLAILQSDAE